VKAVLPEVAATCATGIEVLRVAAMDALRHLRQLRPIDRDRRPFFRRPLMADFGCPPTLSQPAGKTGERVRFRWQTVTGLHAPLLRSDEHQHRGNCTNAILILW